LDRDVTVFLLGSAVRWISPLKEGRTWRGVQGKSDGGGERNWRPGNLPGSSRKKKTAIAIQGGEHVVASMEFSPGTPGRKIRVCAREKSVTFSGIHLRKRILMPTAIRTITEVKK